MAVDWDRVLGLIAPLKRQFEAAASRLEPIHHRLIEKTGDASWKAGDPPEFLSVFATPPIFSEWSGSFHLQAPREELVSTSAVIEGLDEPGWRTLSFPPGRSWSSVVRLRCGEGLHQFNLLAASTWSLVADLAIVYPAPKHFRSILAEHFPSVRRIRPIGDGDASRWVHLIHWIGQSGTHPLLRMEPQSWLGTGRFTADEEVLRRVVEAQGPGSPLTKVPIPVDRIFTESANAFMDSVWALDWIEAQVRSELGEVRRGTSPAAAAPPIDPATKSERRRRKPPKKPSKIELAAFQLYVDLGWSQADVAKKLTEQFGGPVTQGSISRMIKRVREWRGIEKSSRERPKTDPVDPSRLELGPREKKGMRNASRDSD